MKNLLILAVAAICTGVAVSLPAGASPTIAVTVNGSTVTLTQDVPMIVGGSGSGAPTLVDIGNVIVMPDRTVSASGTFSVNGQTLPLTPRVLSYAPGGTLQYAVDGGADIALGTQGQIVVLPFGGVVKPGASMVRVPVTAALTWQAVPAAAPEPSACVGLGFGIAGLGLLAARRHVVARKFRGGKA